MEDQPRHLCPAGWSAQRRDAVPIVALDANVLERIVSASDEDARTFQTLVEAGRLRVFVPVGVAGEIRHPNTPIGVRTAAIPSHWEPHLHAMALTSLSARQHIDRIRVRAVMRGDGRPGKHDADACHISEAAEAGCGYFVTRDGKILRKRDILQEVLPPGLRITTLDVCVSGLGRLA